MKLRTTTLAVTVLLAACIPGLSSTAQARPFGFHGGFAHGGWGGGWGHGGWGGVEQLVFFPVLYLAPSYCCWYEYWCQARFQWYLDLGIPEAMLRLRPHDPDELSHYSTETSDIEFMYPWGWASSRESQPRGLRPHPALGVLGSGPVVFRPGVRTRTTSRT